MSSGSAPKLRPPDVPLACPACLGGLTVDGDELACGCGRRFGNVEGIPDLRLAPDPYLTVEEDRSRSRFVVEAMDRMDLPALLEHYWSVSDVTPRPLRRRYVASARRAEAKAEPIVARLGPPPPAGRVLDVGSGTGAFLTVATTAGWNAVGVEAAPRWLHVSRRRFLDRGIPAPALVGANAESLPFPDGSFDAAVCLGTVPFLASLPRALQQIARVVKPGGRVVLTAVNRFSLGPEPHVALWGVGFLPRRLQVPYVRWRNGAHYECVLPPSYGELRGALRRHFAHVEMEPSAVGNASLGDLGAPGRLLARAYEAARRLPLARSALLCVGPEWTVVARR